MRKLIAAAVTVVVGFVAKLGLDRLKGQDKTRTADMVSQLPRVGRHLIGRAKGTAYRALRRHPAADVDDATLGDRVRSSLGPLEKRLQMPRVHVTVEKGVVILHGEAPNAEAEAQIVQAIEQIPGVQGVRSNLAT